MTPSVGSCPTDESRSRAGSSSMKVTRATEDVRRAMDAMLQMHKIDVAELERAADAA